MRRILKWAALLLGSLTLLLVLLASGVYAGSIWRMGKTYEVETADVFVPSDTASIALGRHIAVTRGCQDCHGERLSGQAFVDDAAVGRIYGPNLTAGKGGIGATYTDRDWVRALRHGLKRDNRSVLFMPSYEYYHLSDEDLGALIAYLKQLPPIDRDNPAPSLGPVGRALVLSGELKLAAEIIDHAAPRPQAPPAGPTKEYGAYLAAASCTGCHGDQFAGGRIPGGSPDWPPAANLTPHPEDGLGGWTEADFFRALRQQKRPDGTALSPVMPAAVGQLTDTELQAIWKFLQALPPQPDGGA